MTKLETLEKKHDNDLKKLERKHKMDLTKNREEMIELQRNLENKCKADMDKITRKINKLQIDLDALSKKITTP